MWHDDRRVNVASLLSLNCTNDGVLEMRRLEGHRLDQLQAAHWDAALRGDFDATKVMLQVIERRCKLFGLNAPLAVRVDPAITDVEFARQVVELITSLASRARTVTHCEGWAMWAGMPPPCSNAKCGKRYPMVMTTVTTNPNRGPTSESVAP
jgi:hypothetical protein